MKKKEIIKAVERLYIEFDTWSKQSPERNVHCARMAMRDRVRDLLDEIKKEEKCKRESG